MAQDTTPPSIPFWKTTPLEAMSAAEWESLCDGCGRCCLVKLEDDDTGEIHATSVGCTLFDDATCRCKDYQNRAARVPDCITLTPEAVRTLTWLPPSCAYRLIAEGRDLYWWHPLVSGDPATVEAAGVSVRGRVKANEDDVPVDQLADFLAAWPLRFPRTARTRNPPR